MKCPKCEFENPDNSLFCGDCGAPLEISCPNCGSSPPAGFKFCNNCGHELRKPSEELTIDLSFDQKIEKIQKYLPKGLTEKILSQKDRIEGERKQVTVMFADMEGFSQLTEILGPEEAYTFMDQVYEILIHKVHDYEGTVNEFTGDGIMALFGAPIALEDAPQRAIRSAYAIHREMTKFSDKIKQENENIPSLKMRIGIHTGPVVVGTLGNDLRVEFKAVGDTVNLASRMERLAESGSTYLTEDTFQLAEGFFRFEALGEKEVKGKAEPVKVYRVLAPSTKRTRFDVSAERGLTPFVGRTRELDLLLDSFERAKTGRGQAISIISEAGVGKSRLLYEFRKAVANEDATFLEGKCLSYISGVAYNLVIDVLRSNFDIQESDEDFQIMDKVKKGLQILGTDEASTSFSLLELLSIEVNGIEKIEMTSEGRKVQIMEAIKRIVLKGSEIRPLIMAFEDLHWMDESSEDVLRYLSENIAGERVFLIFTYRPEFAHTWGGRSYHNQVNLNRLSNRESLTMTSHLLNAMGLDRDLEDFILEKTEGVPFFIEEFIRSFRDLKILEKKNGQYHLAKGARDVIIPSTIQDVIMARIDSLPEDVKEVIQTGSAIEREFSYALIKHVTGIPEQKLLKYLSVLKDSELLYERGIFPQSTYIFKHALTQEVTYDSLVKQSRRDIHTRIGLGIEELYADRIEEHFEMLSHHFEQSGDAAKAVDYLILAGEKLNKHNAVQAASDFFQKALVLSERQKIVLPPDTELRVHKGLAKAIFSIGDIDTAAKEYRKIIDISQRQGMLDQERKGLLGLASMMYIWPVRAEAEQTLQEAMSWAKDEGDKSFESIILSHMGHGRIMDGDPPKANQMTLDAERIAIEAGETVAIFTARTMRSFTERLLGNPKKTVELTEGMFESLRKSYLLIPLMGVILVRGNALAEIGRIEDSISILTDGVDIFEKFGAFFRLASLYNSIGYCYGEIHQYEHAWRQNLRSEEIARRQMKKYPLGRHIYSEFMAQASVNLMENLFDQRKADAAWDRMESFKEESRGKDYDLIRHRWETRMNYLAARILLFRNEHGKAETIIQEGIKTARMQNAIKREGCFLRLLSEIQFSRNEFDNAISSINEGILVLQKVGNPRQLWEAHASLATGLGKLGRTSDAREHWKAASEVILNTANGLLDRELREGFLEANPIREILSKTES
ncbi:adenylate/guanylate cyclase domain-containing protein [Thermodesulfobacteriota bacterium]